MIKRRTALIFIVLLAASVAGGNAGSRYFGEPDSTRVTNEGTLGIARNLRNSVDLPLPIASPRILVKKAERKLFLYSGSTLVRTYRIGLGLSPRVTRFAKVIGARRKGTSTSSPRTTRVPFISHSASVIRTLPTPNAGCATN
jgi:hypothetical protein